MSCSLGKDVSRRASINIIQSSLCILFILLLHAPQYAQDTAERTAISPNPVSGEALVYTLFHSKVPAGKIVISRLPDAANPARLELTLKARTEGLYRRLFWVNNCYTVQADSTTLLPLRSDKYIRQRNIDQDMIISYDHVEKIARAADSLSWEIENDSRDFVSLLFYLRKYPLTEGEERLLHVDVEGITMPIIARDEGSTSVNTPYGHYQAKKITLDFRAPLQEEERAWDTDLLTNRLSKKNVRVSIWFSTDSRRMPVQLIYHSSPFLIKIKLSGIAVSSRTE